MARRVSSRKKRQIQIVITLVATGLAQAEKYLSTRVALEGNFIASLGDRAGRE
jgi:hypothetical protein